MYISEKRSNDNSQALLKIYAGKTVVSYFIPPNNIARKNEQTLISRYSSSNFVMCNVFLKIQDLEIN